MTTHVNIILLGNLDTGKSTICSNLSTVQKESEPTTGIEQTKLIRQYDRQTIDIKLIDTSGDPHFMDLIQPELLHADAVLFIFSLNDQQSFDDLNYWIELAQPFVDDYTTLMILGNKSEDKNIYNQNPQQFAKQKEMLYSEISARYKIGLQEMLKQVVETILERRRNRSAKKELKIQSTAISELRQDKKARNITVGIIGDPSLGNFRVFSKASKQYNAKDTIVPLCNQLANIVHSSLSQKAELFFPQERIILQLIDITDSQLKKLLTNPNFQTPQVLILTFSTQSLKSFQNIQTYLNMFQDDVKIVLIGTKADSSRRQVTHQVIENYSRQKGVKFFQLTDKNNKGIELLFFYLLTQPPKIKATQQFEIKFENKKQDETTNSGKSQSSSIVKYLVGLGLIGALAVFAFTKYRK